MEQQKTKVLQIGLDNWRSTLSLKQEEEIEWHFLNIGVDTTGYREGYSKLMKNRAFDLVLCTDLIKDNILEEFSELIESYRLIIDVSLKGEVSKEIRKTKFPFFLDVRQPKSTLEIIRQNFFPNQIQQGTKFQINEITVNKLFKGEKKIYGQNYIELSGNFPINNHESLISWQYNIAMRERSKNIWLEFEHDEAVTISLSILLLENGTGKVLEVQEFSEEKVKSGIEVEYKDNLAYLGLALSASGEGKLRVGPLHYRDSRSFFGEYIPGGAKVFDEKNQEIFYYFNPGNLKPPLNVYFSGYRSAEGFEGFGMMKKMNHPFLLFTDPRLEGGAFYLGSHSLENQVVETLKKTLNQLGFNRQQLVLSGLSMGTFGALYYGSKVFPHTIIVGKPLTNLGTMASNSKLVRPGQFETSLDILYLSEKQISEEAVSLLNQRFWNTFDQADFSNTKFKVAYMENDDYDSKAYSDLLDHLLSKESVMISKGIPGRHNDNSKEINEWFLSQYDETLKKDFASENNNEMEIFTTQSTSDKEVIL